MADRVVINNDVINKLLANPTARRQVPALAAAKSKIDQENSKKQCCKKKARANASNIKSIKRTLARLPDDQKLKLKAILGGGPVVVPYLNSRGKPAKVRF